MGRSSGKRLRDKYDLFVFDWDGTLASLKWLLRINEAVNPKWIFRKLAFSRRKGLDYTEEDVKEASRRIQRMMEVDEIEANLLTPLVDAFMMFVKPKLHNDAREALEMLDRSRKKIVLFTNGANYRILRELRHLGVEDYFDMIISAQAIRAVKPNPLGLEIAMRAMKVDRRRTLYVGDMRSDMLMAEYAKVDSCAIADGFDSEKALREMRPTYVFRSMEEFKKRL